MDFQTKHTKFSPFDVSIQEIYSPNQDKIGFSIVLRNLSEKRESERLASQARMIAENSPAVLFQVDPNADYQIKYISENINQFGYDSSELMARKASFLELIHPEDQEYVLSLKEKGKSKSGIQSFSGEYRILCSSGKTIWVEDKTSDVLNAEGNISLHQGIFQDITERKNFEQFKEEKDKQYRMLASNIPGTNIFLLDRDRRYILAEGTNFDFWGISRSDFEGKLLSEISLTDQTTVNLVLDQVYQNQEVVETEFEYKGRKYHRTIRPILEGGKIEYALSIIRDVNEEFLAKKTVGRV